MTDHKISLCLAYPHYSNPDSHILFRIADYSLEEDRLYSVVFHDEDFMETPRRIGANPKDIHPGMTALRAWEFDSDNSGKTRSYNYDGNIYEIVFPKELNNIEYSDVKGIRAVLCDGFSMDNSVSDNILISVGKQGSHNAVLFCRKRDLKKIGENMYAISSDTRDMLHSVHCLDEFDIVDGDIINSSNNNISLPNGLKAPVRYFYRSTVLPEPVGIFHPIDFGKYVPTFVSNYIKKNKATLLFSLNDIRKITDVLEAVLNDQEYINEFFKITGYTSKQLEDLLLKHRQTIVASLLGDSAIDSILRKCLFEDTSMYERCVELVRKTWLAEQTEEQQQILSHLEQLKKQRSEIEADLVTKKQQKEEICTEITVAEKSLASKKDELKRIQSDIETELKDFADNIVHSTAVCAVVQGVNNSHAICSGNNTDIITISPRVSGEPEFLDSYDDFQEGLADNLIAIGYEDTVADEMAQLISFGISARCPILLTANEDAIAECVASMFASSVTVVNIGTTSNASEYIPLIKESNNAVVLINGAFSGFSVEHYNEIRYRLTNEGFVTLFSVSDSSLELIPQSILDKSMCLECGYRFNYKAIKQLDNYCIDRSVFSKSYDEDEVIKQRKKLNAFVDSGIINAVTASTYSRFMVDISCNISKDWLLLYQLCLHAKANYKVDFMRDWLEANNIDIDILNSIM